MTTLDEHVPTDEVAEGLARLEPARWLLPVEAYTSQEWFDAEQRLIFRHCWAFAGMTDDVPDVGDYTCVTVGGDPLVVIREPDGRLRAFHNICRHRGVQLLEGRGNVKRGISCFYHRWRYSLDGALKTVPQPDQFPNLDKDDLGLHRASVDSWNGMMWVHVEPDPDQSLGDWLGAFRERLGPFEPLGLSEIKTVRHEIKANWKLFFENHVDGYHLWHLHANSIKGLDHSKQQWRPAGRHWTFYEPPLVPGTHADAALTGLPVLPTHGPEGFGSSVHLVFPNLGIAGGSTFWTTIHATPLAPDRTLVEMRTRIAPMAAPAQAQTLVKLAGRKASKALHQTPLGSPLRALHILGEPRGGGDGVDFVGEDIHAAESLQRALSSSRFAVGPMAKDHEQAVTFFQRNILDHVRPE